MNVITHLTVLSLVNRNKTARLHWLREEKRKHFTLVAAFPTSLTSVCFACKFKTSNAEFLKKFKDRCFSRFGRFGHVAAHNVTQIFVIGLQTVAGYKWCSQGTVLFFFACFELFRRVNKKSFRVTFNMVKTDFTNMQSAGWCTSMIKLGMLKGQFTPKSKMHVVPLTCRAI